MSDIIPDSTLACPRCGHVKTERMPTDACQWFYECEGCHSVLKPKPDDCCVFCSWATVPSSRRTAARPPAAPSRRSLSPLRFTCRERRLLAS